MSEGPSTQRVNHSTTQTAHNDTATVAPNSQASDTASASSTQTAAPSAHSLSHSSATDLSQATTDEVHLQPLQKHDMPRDLKTTERQRQDISGSSSPKSRASNSPSLSSKRMASGTLKSPSPPRSDDPVASAAGIYRRKSTLDKSGRRISELSLQLKTKLTYAMIKVQNGWEQHSIDEVESLAASALASPISTTSTTISQATTFQSPRLTIANTNSRLRGSDASREIAANAYRSTAASRPNSGNATWALPSPHMYSRDHRQHPQQQHPPGLAPAPDLRPKTRHQQQHQQQPVDGSKAMFSPDPVTLRATTPTPQEKDAVDTLLFMSSPANSQRFTHRPDPSISSTQGSPSRMNSFRMPRRSFGASIGPPTLYDRASASSEDGESLMTPTLSTSTSKRGSALLAPSGGADAERRAKRRSYGRLESEMDVDRLLDQMRDVASSEEEVEIAMPRVAATSKPVVVRM